MKTAEGHFSAVQGPDAQVQIQGKGQPQQVRNLQQPRQVVRIAELFGHPGYQKQQRRQPQSGKAVSLEVEEHDAPGKVHGQLGQEQIQPPVPGI